jgi:hypothetical protein
MVAAARGTVILFDTGIMNGQPFTRITCLEGIVDIHALAAPPRTPPALLSPGQSILVVSGQPLPAPMLLSPAELEKLKRDTSMSGAEIRLPDVATSGTIIGTVNVTPIPIVPPINQQPPKQPSSVNIGVKF